MLVVAALIVVWQIKEPKSYLEESDAEELFEQCGVDRGGELRAEQAARQAKGPVMRLERSLPPAVSTAAPAMPLLGNIQRFTL